MEVEDLESHRDSLFSHITKEEENPEADEKSIRVESVNSDVLQM